MNYSSLRWRLIALSFGVSLCTLFAACVTFYWRELQDSREGEVQQVSTAAKVVAESATAALAFSDKIAASELLSAFRALSVVRSAILSSIQNETLAHYSRDTQTEYVTSDAEWSTGADLTVNDSIIHDDHSHIRIPVVHSQEVIGHLEVIFDTTDLYAHARSNSDAALLIFLIGSAASFILGAILSNRLTRPIQELAASMAEISHSKDYSKRLTTTQKDEIGELFERFNEMLEQVEFRDSALREHQQKLEQRVAERTIQLQRERQQLMELISHAPVAIAMLDNDMRYVAHSELWCESYNLSGISLIGRSHYEIFPDIPERWREIHRSTLKNARAHANEDTFQRSNGEKIHLRWAIHPWYLHDGTQGGIIMVTDRIDDLVAAREAALHTARIRSEFLTNVSHELRTPLNGIIGFTELLLDERDNLSQTAQGYVESVQSSGKVLLALINDILDFSKLEERKLTLESSRFKLADSMRAAAQVFAGQAERKGITLEISSALAEILVKGDQLRLQQVFMNLIGNAVKFTQRGYVKVALDSIACIDNGLEVQFSVKDTGIGIPKEQQAHIFEAFAQADGSTTRKYGGTGLGLSICVQLVELMGGKIWVESTEGVGSTFYFSVRLANGEETPELVTPDQKNQNSNNYARNTPLPRILIAEDNPMNQKLVATILERAGYSVELVGNGREAVEAVKQSNFAAILMDLQMPVMNGLDAIHHIRSLSDMAKNRVPIVALTAHAFSEHREQCEAVGVNDYLTKPLNRQHLLEVLRRFATPVQ